MALRQLSPRHNQAASAAPATPAVPMGLLAGGAMEELGRGTPTPLLMQPPLTLAFARLPRGCLVLVASFPPASFPPFPQC